MLPLFASTLPSTDQPVDSQLIAMYLQTKSITAVLVRSRDRLIDSNGQHLQYIDKSPFSASHVVDKITCPNCSSECNQRFHNAVLVKAEHFFRWM